MQKVRKFLLKDKYDEYGYLTYNYSTDKFHIEFFNDVFRYGNTPAMVSLPVSTGRKVLDDDWALDWVRSRIIPANRQNITDILKANGLISYSEIDMLVICKGRCLQDDMWLEEVFD